MTSNSTSLITILHLSDFHFKTESVNQTYYRKEALNQLIQDIKKKIGNKVILRPNYIVVTGDIANTGDENEYTEHATKFFDDLTIGLDFDYSNIILCPGNHDKNLNMFSDSILKNIITKHLRNEQLSSEEINIIEQFFNVEETDEKKNSFVTKFDMFYKYYNNFCLSRPFSRPQENWTSDTISNYTHGIHIKNDVDFLVLNSTLNSISGNVDYGRMRIHKHSTQFIIDKISNNPDKLKIVLQHHPISWFHWEDIYAKTSTFTLFEKLVHNSDIILCGHIHNNNRGFPYYINGDTPMIFGGASFTKEKEIDGYFTANLVTIDKLFNKFKLVTFIHSVDITNKHKWINLDERTYPLSITKSLETVQSIELLYEKFNQYELNEQNLLKEIEYLKAQIYPDNKRID